MRVTMISRPLVVESYRAKLVALARQPGVELAAIVPPWWPEGGRRLAYRPGGDAGYRTVVEPVALNGHFHLHFFPGLARRLRELRPQILHIDEEPYNLATVLALLAGKRVGARVVFFTWQNLCKRYPWPFGAFERLVLRHANYAIAGNAEAGAILRRKGYRGPLALIPQFGFDPAVFSPAPRRPSADGERPFTVGYAGRVEPYKGVDLLLRACAGLDGEWRLRYLGAGSMLSELKALAASLGVADRVRFEPAVGSAAMPGWFAEIDALVLPSRTWPNWKEQFGRVLVEAMLCQVPVVGSDSGEIPRVIGDAGLIFPEGDVTALRARLACLRRDPAARQRLAAAGRARALDRFTHERVASDTYAVYRQMLDHPWPNPRPTLIPTP